MVLANTMEAERDHALDRPEKDEDGLFSPEENLMAEANREDKASDELTKGKFEALDSQASFDRVLFDGGEFGTGADIGSDDELDFLGIPGLLDAEQVGTLLRQRQHEQQSRKNVSRLWLPQLHRPYPTTACSWTYATNWPRT